MKTICNHEAEVRNYPYRPAGPDACVVQILKSNEIHTLRTHSLSWSQIPFSHQITICGAIRRLSTGATEAGAHPGAGRRRRALEGRRGFKTLLFRRRPEQRRRRAIRRIPVTAAAAAAAAGGFRDVAAEARGKTGACRAGLTVACAAAAAQVAAVQPAWRHQSRRRLRRRRRRVPVDHMALPSGGSPLAPQSPPPPVAGPRAAAGAESADPGAAAPGMRRGGGRPREGRRGSGWPSCGLGCCRCGRRRGRRARARARAEKSLPGPRPRPSLG